VDDMAETYATMTSMVAANGTAIPVAITSDAKKPCVDRGLGRR
jgi:hypothetical protein